MGSDRGSSIVRILERTGTWTTASALAAELGCSARTVKSDVASLNRRAPGVIASGPKGYRIGDSQLIASLVSREPTDAPQTMDERKRHILFELLMRNRKVDAIDLTDELCVSLSTLDNELVAVKRELSSFGLRLRQREGKLFIEGDERSEKRLVNSLIFDETKNFFNQMELVNRYFPELDLQELHDRVEASLKDRGFFINDYALSNLILHVAIAVERARNGFASRSTSSDTSGANGTESKPKCHAIKELACEIRDIAEQVCDVKLSAEDLESLRLILSANLTHVDHLDIENGEGYRTAAKLFETIKRRVDADFGLDFSNKEFSVRFTLHLANMLSRLRYGVLLRNPQLTSIKNGYPFIYDVAVSIADMVHAETHADVGEDEIAYIALHVGCLVEEQRSSVDKLHGVLVSLRRTAASAECIKRFSDQLSSMLVVDAVVPSMDAVSDLTGLDLLIADVPIAGYDALPTVQISPFFNDRDVRAVSERVVAIRHQRTRNSIKHDLETFFNPELFFANPGFADRDEAITVMGGHLIEEGYAFEDFTMRLRERESVSASAYQDVALPHPLEMDARRTAVAVSLHPRGLAWGEATVYAVLMLAIRREDRALFQEIFDFIAHVLMEAGAARYIARSQSFEEFVDRLLEYA